MNYTILNSQLSVEISSKGGELQSICDAERKEYLWQGKKGIWEERGPNLFPYIGRMTEKTYQFRNKKYQMDIHGFLPSSEMKLIEQKKDSLILRLESSEQTLKQYPFLFELDIIWKLKESTLDITYRIKNKDTKNMYFGIGGHPGFQVPLEKRLEFEDYRIDFGKAAHPYREIMSEDCFVLGKNEPFPLQEGRYLYLTHDLFDHDAIILTNIPEQVTLGSEKGNKKIIVKFAQMKYLGIWHRPGKKRIMCV